MGDTYEGSQEALLDQLDRLELVATALEEALETVVARLVRVEAGMRVDGKEDSEGFREALARVEDRIVDLSQRLGQMEDTNFDSVARAAVRRALKDMSNDR